MKKLAILIIALVASVSCYAQKEGDFAIGGGFGIAPCLEKGAGLTNFGLGARVQYNIIDPVRIEGVMNYWFKSKGVGVFDIIFNAHYIIPVASKVKLYPLAGLGYGHLSGGGGANKFTFNVGLGSEFDITSRLSAFLELKYQYMSHFSRLPIQVGVVYRL